MASNARAAASIGRGGGNGDGKEPDPKRRRRLDAGGPIEDDEVARQKLRDAKVYERGVDGTWREYVGFDPDNVRDIKSIYADDAGARADHAVKPMGYFAERGDLPMMRWLYVNGADARDEDVAYWFPMYQAAFRGKLDACKWLFAHGAVKDIKRRAGDGFKLWNGPLYASFITKSERNVSRWLILNGALCKDDNSGDLDLEIMKRDLTYYTFRGGYAEERKLLLEWANDLYRPRTSFYLFLSGALSVPQHSNNNRRNLSPLQQFSGEPGIRELIGDYVGFVRGREARIVRKLTEMLPNLIQQLDGQ